MTDKLPLSGLRIAVTRPQAQADALMLGIEKLGGTCIRFPLLEITPLADLQPLQTACSRLNEFDLAIFISPNAARFGIAGILSAGPLPSRLVIAAVGGSTAKALHELGIHQVLAPLQGADSEALLEMPELQQVKGLKIAIFRGDHGRERRHDDRIAEHDRQDRCRPRLDGQADPFEASPHAFGVGLQLLTQFFTCAVFFS